MSIIKPSTKWPLIFELNFELNPHLEAGSLKECVKHDAENILTLNTILLLMLLLQLMLVVLTSDTDDLYQVGMHSVNSRGIYMI